MTCSNCAAGLCDVCPVDLLPHIRFADSCCLNESVNNAFRRILKPNRTARDVTNVDVCESAVDGELLFKIVFDGAVQIKKIVINALVAVERVCAYVNVPAATFDTVERLQPTQEWTIGTHIDAHDPTTFLREFETRYAANWV